MRGILCALWASVIALSPAACESVAGIETRTFDEVDVECRKFCSGLDGACGLIASGYASFDTCVGVCKLMDHGVDNEVQPTFSLSCRSEQLRAAENSKDQAAECQAAGPGGNEACGSLCENYCDLYSAACPKNALPRGECLAKCALLPTAKNNFVDPTPKGNYEGDTVQCRIVHAAAAAADPRGADSIHCGHARFVSDLHCFDTDPKALCPKICSILDESCTDEDTQQYESVAQCLATCNAISKQGAVTDAEGNSRGCRYYHAQNVRLQSSHCSHAGPSGFDAVGHCGDQCTSYCELVQAACGDQINKTFASKCYDECSELDGATGHYSVFEGSTYSCRLLNTTRALLAKEEGEDTSGFCEAALGISDCK